MYQELSQAAVRYPIVSKQQYHHGMKVISNKKKPLGYLVVVRRVVRVVVRRVVVARVVVREVLYETS